MSIEEKKTCLTHRTDPPHQTTLPHRTISVHLIEAPSFTMVSGLSPKRQSQNVLHFKNRTGAIDT